MIPSYECCRHRYPENAEQCSNDRFEQQCEGDDHLSLELEGPLINMKKVVSTNVEATICLVVAVH